MNISFSDIASSSARRRSWRLPFAAQSTHRRTPAAMSMRRSHGSSGVVVGSDVGDVDGTDAGDQLGLSDGDKLGRSDGETLGTNDGL